MSRYTERIMTGMMAFGIFLWAGSPLVAQTIDVKQLASAPTIDGSDNDWAGVEAVAIPLHKNNDNVTVGISTVSIKAGTSADEVYLFIQWDDATMDDQHKPFVWDAAKSKYVAGKQREDRLAIQFAMEGDYTTNWLSGKSSTADMWHWKAARTNPLGLMHDKMTIIGLEPVKKAYKTTADNGATIYIQRPSDKGDKLYTTKRYSAKKKDIMPKYILADNPQGSITDVQCKGVWENGKWSLEIRRKLNTGNSDDVVFAPGKAVMGGIAVFDHSGDDNHAISETLNFQF